jgi:hypothetical protein
MRSSSSGCLLRLVAVLLSWGAMQGGAQSPPAHKAPGPEAPDAQRTKVPTLSLADVEELVKAYKDLLFNEDEVRQKLSRSLGFEADKETLERLRQDGATDAIIEVVKKFAIPEKPKPTSTLSVLCAPAECSVEINDQAAGSTTDGRLVKPGLEPGEITVNFKKHGYLTVQKVVRLDVASGVPVSVTLEPTRDTLAENGKKLHDEMLAALGASTDLKKLRSVTAGGSVTSYAKGKPSEWDFDVAMGPPRLLEMKVTGSSGELIYRCSGEKCEPKKKGFPLGRKQLLPAVAEELENNLRGLSHFDFVSVLEGLNSPHVRFTARTAEANSRADQHLRADGDDFACDLTIGPDGLPTLVEYASKAGLGSGVTISYGDYVKVGDYRYPKHTTIRIPDAASGLEVRLDHIDLGSNLHASDFPK